MGLLLQVAVPDSDPVRERQAAVDGVASVVCGPSLVQLSPDLLWWYGSKQVSILAWLVAPPQPLLPPDRFAVPRHALAEGEVELQVVLPEAGHDAAALELGEVLGALGFVGSRPRWVDRDGERTFLACWTGPADAPLPGIAHPHRRVPACPPGLEGDWLGIDPAWYAGGSRVFCRWHCGLLDRDLLPECLPRDGDAVDTAVAAALSALGPLEPVTAGRDALRLVLDVDAAGWDSVVTALGALEVAEISPVAYVAMRGKTTVLLFRSDRPAPEEPPGWMAR